MKTKKYRYPSTCASLLLLLPFTATIINTHTQKDPTKRGGALRIYQPPLTQPPKTLHPARPSYGVRQRSSGEGKTADPSRILPCPHSSGIPQRSWIWCRDPQLSVTHMVYNRIIKEFIRQIQRWTSVFLTLLFNRLYWKVLRLLSFVAGDNLIKIFHRELICIYENLSNNFRSVRNIVLMGEKYIQY